MASGYLHRLDLCVLNLFIAAKERVHMLFTDLPMCGQKWYGICEVSMRMALVGLLFKYRTPAARTVCEGLGGMDLLEEVCHWGGTDVLKDSSHSYCTLSASSMWINM